MLSPFNDPADYIVGIEIKRAIGLLYDSNQALTAEQISEHGVDADVKGGNKEAFFDTLAKYPNVNFDGHRFSYKHMPCPIEEVRLLRLMHSLEEANLEDATEEEEVKADDHLCTVGLDLQHNRSKSNRRPLAPVSSNKPKMKVLPKMPNLITPRFSYLFRNKP